MTKWTNSSLQIAYYDNVLDEDGLIRIILELQAENEKLTEGLDKANAKIEKLRAVLENLRKKKHYECEDCWYSCPKSEDYCGEDRRDICTCGMDRINTIIDKALKGGE